MNKKCFAVKTGHLGGFCGLSGVYVWPFRLFSVGSGLKPGIAVLRFIYIIEIIAILTIK